MRRIETYNSNITEDTLTTEKTPLHRNTGRYGGPRNFPYEKESNESIWLGDARHDKSVEARDNVLRGHASHPKEDRGDDHQHYEVTEEKSKVQDRAINSLLPDIFRCCGRLDVEDQWSADDFELLEKFNNCSPKDVDDLNKRNEQNGVIELIPHASNIDRYSNCSRLHRHGFADEENRHCMQHSMSAEEKKDYPPTKLQTKPNYKPTRRVYNGLEIIMELQQQEIEQNLEKKRQTLKSHRKVTSHSCKTDVQNGNQNTALKEYRKENMHTTEQAEARHESCNILNSNASLDKELRDVYSNYRIKSSFLVTLVKEISCNLPLYYLKRRDKYSEINRLTDMKNICSETAASSFRVRGPTYIADGVKVPSNDAFFSLLGADMIVNKDRTGSLSDVCVRKGSYLNRLRMRCKNACIQTPFLIVVNFIVPWGNLLIYFVQPDGSNASEISRMKSSSKGSGAERSLFNFLSGDNEYRNERLKFIPRIVNGPWVIKKMVPSKPALIGQKIPTSYFGSLRDGYLEICLNVTKGGNMANSICNAVASKCTSITVDLAFLVEGKEEESLPEHVFAAMRLHHISLKNMR